jgi:hypothetical protein
MTAEQMSKMERDLFFGQLLARTARCGAHDHATRAAMPDARRLT